ncbi:Uma2 family endonuclease [Symbioplanes lichenis]|uniref:Uma2 family endonuclease n=1 Tax=Symbioplanes lichenis TaxID=1629072 RepID=UPI002739A1B2|nr:Uma2 family endonuclease [Actinoplanes lichenis]
MTAVPLYVPDGLDLTPLLGRDDLTFDDVKNLPEDFRYELRDGRLVLLPTPFYIHQRIAYETVAALDANAPDDVAVSPEISVFVDGSELRPDGAVIDIGGVARIPVFAADVRLVIEVVSTGSSESAGSREDNCGYKAGRYAEAGIPLYWVIDPLGERVTFTEFVLSADGSYRRGPALSELVELDRPWPVTLDLPVWTAYRDKVSTPRRRR